MTRTRLVAESHYDLVQTSLQEREVAAHFTLPSAPCHSWCARAHIWYGWHGCVRDYVRVPVAVLGMRSGGIWRHEGPEIGIMGKRTLSGCSGSFVAKGSC